MSEDIGITAGDVHEKCLEFDEINAAMALFGPQGANLTRLSEKSGVIIDSRGTTARLRSESKDDLDFAAKVLISLYETVRNGKTIAPPDVDAAVRIFRPAAERKPYSSAEPAVDGNGIPSEDKCFFVSKRKKIIPKTRTQQEYLNAIESQDMIFGIGPAGTGKTYLAVAAAVSRLTKREVKRLILTRPAVEAGEKLGFLPGDLIEKVDPYLRPLYDALHDMLDAKKVKEMMEDGDIEIAPLAFMRGRTLNDAFIILDEAQNTTPEQMKMFLTRLGFGSKAVITGDVTQIDLPYGAKSGLVEASLVLADVEGVGFVQFKEADVIRHPLVARIVNAYERNTKER